MEPVEHTLCVRAVLLDARVDPAGAVAGHHLDGCLLLVGELLEEQVEHVLAVSVVRPDDPVPFVVDDDGQIRVALPVAGLVHADRCQPVERRGRRSLQPAGDPMGDLARSPPRHVQETAHGPLVGDGHQPRALRLEVPREPASRLRPRHGRDDHAALRAVHPGHRRDQLDPPASEILVAPSAHAAATVIAAPLPPAPRASEHARTRAHPHLEHGFGAHGTVDDADALDDHAFDVEELFEYAVHQALFGCVFLGRKHPTRKALFSYRFNASPANNHPRKQQ